MRLVQMMFRGPDVGGASAAVEKAVDTVVASVPSTDTPEKGSKKEDKKLDDEGEFFVRRISEEVRKALAEIFPKPEEPKAEEPKAEEKTTRKRKPAQESQPKKSFLGRLKFPGMK